MSQDLQANRGFFVSSFRLPELIRCPAPPGAPGLGGWRLFFSVSVPPNSLCLSLGTWSIEASYQSAARQKFKAAFDVKEYGEQGVVGRARWDTQGAGLVSWCTYCVPGPELGAGEQDHIFQPLGVARVTEEGAGQGGDKGDSKMLRVSTTFPPPSAPVLRGPAEAKQDFLQPQ